MLVSKRIKYSNKTYGQLVIGPPGSGKSTYCFHMLNFFKKLGRKVGVVNMDPANENFEYQPEIDIMKLVSIQDVMENYNLGPNGALIYCMKYIEKNFEWLLKQLKASSNNYFLFDCPGQVELYSHDNSLAKIFSKFQFMDYHLCTVQLIDSHYCSVPSKFISAILLSLNTMLQMGLPHINVLSKADLLYKYESKLLFNLDFYTDIVNLKYLLDTIENSSSKKKCSKLNAAIVSVIEDYSLVSFKLLNVRKTESLLRLKNMVDRANGFVFSVDEGKCINELLAYAVESESETKRIENDIYQYL